MQNPSIAKENNISPAFFLWGWVLFLEVVVFLGSEYLQFCVSSSDFCAGPPVYPRLKESFGMLGHGGSLLPALYLWDEGRTTGAPPTVCVHPHASERARRSSRVNVIYQDFSLTSRRVGSRSRPSVLSCGSAVLRKGQGADEKVLKVNTRVVPPEFSKSVSDLWSTADGCELFMSGFWDDFNYAYFFFPSWRILTRM